MRRYLATLHKRSDTHKKNFALAVSGGFTLLIFGVWLFVNYSSTGSEQVAEQASQKLAAAHEASPIESLVASLSTAWDELTKSFKELTGVLGGVDLESGYREMKDKTLNTYGR